MIQSQQEKMPTPINKAEWKPVLLVSAIFFTLCLIFVLHRHFTFYSSYDQGIFNQVFWNGIHGRFFQSSLSSQLSTNVVHAGELPDVSYHRLGQHFTPALLLWLPLYAIFPNPATLAVFLVIFTTSAGLVLYVLAREHLEPKLSRWIVFGYYSANAVVGPTLCNFHDISQIPLFMFTLLLAMEKRWWWLFSLMCILMVMVREDSGITLFGVGVYLILSRRYPKIGVAVCAFSFFYILALTNLIMPIFSDDISKRFMLERFGQYTDAPEASTLDIIWGMISQPWILLNQLITPVFQTIKYLIGQLLPFALVPAVAPSAWMVAGPPLFKLLIAEGKSVLSINIRYAMSVVPGLCYGAILWWSGQSFNNFWQQKDAYKPRQLSPFFKKFWTTCIAISLFFTITANPNRTLYFFIPDSVDPWVHVSLPQQWQRSSQMRSMLAQIPPDASVSATTYLIPHLSGRREVIRLNGIQLINDQQEVTTVDYIMADLWRLKRYQSAFKGDRGRLKSYTQTIQKLLNNQEFGLIDFKNGVVLLQQGVKSKEELLPLWNNFYEEIQQLDFS